MNATPTSNNRYMTILIVVLIVVLLVLAFNVLAWFWMMGGGMMVGMMGMNGQTMNTMISACTEMMQNFQSP